MHCLCGADVADFTDNLWGHEVADHLLAGRLLFQRLLENGVALDVGARPPFPCSSKAGHSMPDMEEESLALLLTVVADIDSGFDLLRDDPLQGGVASLLDFGRVDRFPARAPGV
jgi:hypothetical protein